MLSVRQEFGRQARPVIMVSWLDIPADMCFAVRQEQQCSSTPASSERRRPYRGAAQLTLNQLVQGSSPWRVTNNEPSRGLAKTRGLVRTRVRCCRLLLRRTTDELRDCPGALCCVMNCGSSHCRTSSLRQRDMRLMPFERNVSRLIGRRDAHTTVSSLLLPTIL